MGLWCRRAGRLLQTAGFIRWGPGVALDARKRGDATDPSTGLVMGTSDELHRFRHGLRTFKEFRDGYLVGRERPRRPDSSGRLWRALDRRATHARLSQR